VATRRWLTAKRQRQAAQPNASPTRISRAALAGGCAQDRDAWGKQERQDRITNLIIDLAVADWSMIRKSAKRFSLATNAKRLRGDHAQTIT
jgi:hypothetical protein